MLSRIHGSSSFFPPFSTVPIALCFHLHLILISEFNTCNTELQVIFLRLLADCPRHGYQESLTSIFPYFSEIDLDNLYLKKLDAHFQDVPLSCMLFSDMLSLVTSTLIPKET